MGSRLAQFIVLGGALFAVTRAGIDDRRIHLDGRRGAALLAERTDPARDPVAQEVADEVLVREARRLGLDSEDAIVRRRLIQKMLLLAEDLGGAGQVPTEGELQQYFAAHAHQYRLPAQLRFVHVYATTRERAQALSAAVAQLLPPRRTDPAPLLGDPLASSRVLSVDEGEVTQRFGAAFATALAGLPTGVWSAPIESTLGWHFVAVLERQPARAATYAQVQGALALDFLIDRRQAAVDKFVRAALERYQIDVDGRRIHGILPPPRTAVHAQDSAED